MTKDAQSALRRVIEKYTANVRFCIICNYLSSIIPPIQSRCTRFRFAPLSLEHIVPKLEYVIEQEKLTVTDSGKEALLKLSCGDMRRVLNILQSASMAFPKIDETSVYQCVGQPTPKHIEKILHILMNDTFSSACRKVQQSCGGEGYALVDIISRLHDIIFELDLPSNVIVCLISALADTEQRLSVGASDKVQIGGIVAAFIRARKLIKEAAAKQ
ncbi:replication factor C small subunit domain protein [Oesophagostomum dentatum]|uniref:Activator 1 subunit 5 n=1 Tax=Oesophagostomum dentatum TaxID=61180 RepID=A0A0B1T5W6_OESDE|nr:replication factor C small subunit domain protein [Oesophagostomum dentatum]